jgi:hypothetical protein
VSIDKPDAAPFSTTDLELAATLLSLGHHPVVTDSSRRPGQALFTFHGDVAAAVSDFDMGRCLVEPQSFVLATARLKRAAKRVAE